MTFPPDYSINQKRLHDHMDMAHKAPNGSVKARHKIAAQRLQDEILERRK
jgi:hypothetical protein